MDITPFYRVLIRSVTEIELLLANYQDKLRQNAHTLLPDKYRNFKIWKINTAWPLNYDASLFNWGIWLKQWEKQQKANQAWKAVDWDIIHSSNGIKPVIVWHCILKYFLIYEWVPFSLKIKNVILTITDGCQLFWSTSVESYYTAIRVHFVFGCANMSHLIYAADSRRQKATSDSLNWVAVGNSCKATNKQMFKNRVYAWNRSNKSCTRKQNLGVIQVLVSLQKDTFNISHYYIQTPLSFRMAHSTVFANLWGLRRSGDWNNETYWNEQNHSHQE